jgi:excisionase family DNA binding protein
MSAGVTTDKGTGSEPEPERKSGEQRALDKAPVADQILYSVEQSARVLGVSARLLWAFVQRGELRTRHVGTRVLVHRRELEKFALRDHETKGEANQEAEP